MLGIVELSGSMLQRNGAEEVGQVDEVPDPKTDPYGVFSMAIMTM
jgi:hypothetical protein